VIRSIFSALALALVISPAYAAGPDAATITKSIEAVAADPVKAKAYCDMAAKFEEIGDDEKKAEAAGDEIDGYFKTLGPEFEAAWDAGQNAEENSAEGKAFDEAMAKLDASCGPSDENDKGDAKDEKSD
jgi:hypothetical protein